MAERSAGVAWGDWNHFVVYTNTLMPYFNHGITQIMAAIATLGELVFGICLIVGFKIRQVAIGAAVLTFCFGLSMAIFAGISAPFSYPVFVFTGAAWVLSGLTRYRWSLDDLMNRK